MNIKKVKMSKDTVVYSYSAVLALICRLSRCLGQGGGEEASRRMMNICLSEAYYTSYCYSYRIDVLVLT